MNYVLFARGANKLRNVWANHFLLIRNRLFLKGFGIEFGKNCQITANLTFRIARESKISIGDNFRLTGSNLTNPLNNRRSCFAVSDNAILKIGNNVGMSSPTIWVQDSVVIGNYVNLGGGTTIMDTDAHSLKWQDRRDGMTDQANKINKGIVIEDDVLVGAYSIILKGVHIGARSIIGAGSVVTKDIPTDCIAAGNPCKVIRRMKDRQ